MRISFPILTLRLWQIRVSAIMLTVAAIEVFWFRTIKPGVILAEFLWTGITAFFVLPCFFRRLGGSFSQKAIVLQYGLLVRRRKILPTEQIVRMTTVQTPLAKHFRLVAVFLIVPGGAVFLPEVSNQTAEPIRAVLQNGVFHEKI